MSRHVPTDWVLGEDLAQLSESDRAQVLDWLRGCGVDPDRTRAIRFDWAAPDDVPIVVAERYAEWPIAVGLRGIEMRTETHVMVGDVPRPLSAWSA
jgi:hypothetical protein